MAKKDDIVKSLQDKVMNYITNELASKNFNINTNQSYDNYLFDYVNFVNKTHFIDKKWNIIESPSLNCPSNVKNGFELLKDNLRNGINIASYLSKGYLKPYDDMLLNDWGIHHFHLGESMEKDGFIKRTDELAFVIFNDDNAYIIAIQKHGNWANQKFIEEIDKNWPNIIEHSLAKNAESLSFSPTNEMQEQFRKLGLISPIQLSNGKIYLPIGGGYNINGSGMFVNFSMTNIYRNIHNYANIVEKENLDINKVKLSKMIFECSSFGYIVVDLQWVIDNLING